MIDLINNISACWWTYFIPLVIQNTLFLALIYGVLSLLKKIPAHARYSITLIGLIKLLIPAFIPLSLLTVPQITALNKIINLNPVTTTTISGVPSSPIMLTAPAISMLIWASISTIMLVLPLITLGRIRYQLRQAKLIEKRTLPGMKNIQIHKTANVTLPMTIGMFTKRIYVPLLWEEWTADHRELAIRHELAHIQRLDGLVNGLQTLVRAIYFFHPLVWLLNQQIDELREMASDEVAQDYDSISYSRFLVEVAENMIRAQVDCPTVNSLLKKKKELFNRVQYLLEEKMYTNKRLVRFVMPAMVSLASLLSWNCQSQTGLLAVSPEDDVLAKIVATENPDNLPKVKFIPYDVAPEPIGGYAAIQKNVIYPELALKTGIEGVVIVQIFIDKTGKATDAVILQGATDDGLNDAAIVALQKTKWIPAKQRDLSVGVWVTVPIAFKLDKDKPSE